VGSSALGASREDSSVKYGGSDTMTTDLIIAGVFFILGLIPTYYFYVKSIRIKEPVYSIRSSNIISDDTSDFPDLVVSYRGQQVRNFTFSTVLFFNRGALTIDRPDIASRNPLRIVPRDCNILEASVFIYNNPSNGITLTSDETRGGFTIDFEYLNQNDGAILTILHDGVSSENLVVVGDMKEVRSLRRVAPASLEVASPPNYRRIVVWTALIFLAAAAVIALSLAFENYEWLRANPMLVVIAVTILVSTFVPEIIRIIILGSRRTLIPKGLEMFGE
jgi:uncharacterized membrane protein